MLEETVYLVRKAPWSVLACHAAGSMPFALGLLYFWADMSRSAFAKGRCALLSAILAALFLWMKCWHSVYARGLYRLLGGEGADPWTWRRSLGCLATQALIQPTKFVVLPVALILLLPTAWCCAFYQNVTCLGDGREKNLRTLFRDCWSQAFLFPRENHVVLSVFSLLSLIVFLNVTIAAFLLPFFIKGLLGVETAFTRSATSLFNTTFLASAMVITYLCLDPLLKAYSVLRVFYGFSLRTGADLRVDIERFWGKSRAFLCFVLLCLSLEGFANANPKTPNSRILPPASLDKVIQEVIERPEYTWRMPRERNKEEEELGLFAAFMEGAMKTLHQAMERPWNWLRTIFRKIVDWLPEPFKRSGRSFPLWQSTNQLLLFLLLACLLCILALFVLRRKGTATRAAMPGPSTSVVPDLRDESVGADALPLDRWLDMAEKFMTQGDLRLSLRALYFACLSLLAEHRFLGIAKFKSNQDYRRELARRTHSMPELHRVFGENVLLFDRSWYGTHEVDEEVWRNFRNNWERIRALVSS